MMQQAEARNLPSSNSLQSTSISWPDGTASNEATDKHDTDHHNRAINSHDKDHDVRDDANNETDHNEIKSNLKQLQVSSSSQKDNTDAPFIVVSSAGLSLSTNSVGNTSRPTSHDDIQHEEAQQPNSQCLHDYLLNNEQDHITKLTSEDITSNHDDNVYVTNLKDETIESKSTETSIINNNNIIGNEHNIINKPNGLKNRIRPPPIDIGKVSNFTVEDRSPNTQNHFHNLKRSHEIDSQPNRYNSINIPINRNTQSSDQQSINSNTNLQHNNWQSSSTNLKFWTKLNDSCNTNLVNRNPNNNYINKTSMLPNRNEQVIPPYIEDDSFSIHNHMLNGNGNGSISEIENNFPTNERVDLINRQPEAVFSHQAVENNYSNHDEIADHVHEDNLNYVDRGLRLVSNDFKGHDPSIESEHDDSSAHGGDTVENGGGNVIGVDNPTPPASSSHLANSFEQHHSRSNSDRSKSNNPFLVGDEEFIRGPTNLNNFHRRPASFMAATTSNIYNKQQATLDNVMNKNQQRLCEQLNLMNISNDSKSHLSSIKPNCDNNWVNADIVMMQNPNKTTINHQYIPKYQQDLRQYPNTPFSQKYDQIEHQSIYDDPPNLQEQKQNPKEPTISSDSENAVCKLPPSTELPHWVDAVYELNNAILEPNSIGGGAENGEFIYIINSGDIILELNQIKVSGFTLVEFNELVESQTTHLLTAVQTKHSHSLCCDLKEYLKSSFPKNSPDKGLQDLIRENIYRRTIPCTTRPPRPGEVDKVDYHFLTMKQFNDLNERGLLLESGVYGGHHYGTMRPSFEISVIHQTDALDSLDITSDNATAKQGLHPPYGDNPLYENQTSLNNQPDDRSRYVNNIPTDDNGLELQVASKDVMDDEELPLPHGWEKVVDATHGTFYIDHNTQRTQYERPYEIELIKGSFGFGFTLVEADNGMILVRSIIPDGPAFQNGIMRPGDILISALGISVSVLQHTDIAKLFAAFAVGDRVRLTFGRTNYVLGDNLANLVPDEYLFSNGANGDMALAINPAHPNFTTFQNNSANHDDLVTNLEYDILKISLKKCNEQGFGFTLGESVAGQKVKEIQNASACMDLKQGDTLIKINDVDVTHMSHTDVVALLKDSPVGEMINLTIKRRTRFRSKTPLVTHSDYYQSSQTESQQRNCRTPSFDGMNDRHQRHSIATLPRAPTPNDYNYHGGNDFLRSYQGDHRPKLYSTKDGIYYKQNPKDNSLRELPQIFEKPFDTTSLATSTVNSGVNNNQANPTSIDNYKHMNDIERSNQYNNFMKDDKLMMMQMQQQKYQQQPAQSNPSINIYQTEDYKHLPLYSNAELMQTLPTLAMTSEDNMPISNINYQPDSYNYYANNEEIALQRSLNHKQQNLTYPQTVFLDQLDYGVDLNNLQQTPTSFMANIDQRIDDDTSDEFEYHSIDLVRENPTSNWGIRLIGGAEVHRAISIGSVVFGGAAFENGRLKSGDEIILINGIKVVGSTHRDVVELISSCTHKVSLVIRRKKFAEACEVVLTRSLEEGFGFVIISSCDCVSLIGKIIEGSPAQRCQQLHVKDRIIAVNGREITSRMKHSEIVNMIKETGSILKLRIIPANCYTVELIKNSPNDNFGFTMRGGSEYDGAGLYILRVAPTGLARDLLNVGDQIIEINEIPTVGMTHKQAASIIMHSDPIVKLKLRRNHQIPPSLLVDSPRELHKFNQVTAEIKTIQSMTPTGKGEQLLEDPITTQQTYISEQQPIPNVYRNDNNDLSHQNGLALYAT